MPSFRRAQPGSQPSLPPLYFFNTVSNSVEEAGSLQFAAGDYLVTPITGDDTNFSTVRSQMATLTGKYEGLRVTLLMPMTTPAVTYNQLAPLFKDTQRLRLALMTDANETVAIANHLQRKSQAEAASLA